MAEDPKVHPKVQETRDAASLVALQEENDRLVAELAALRGSQPVIEEPRVLRDPFDAQNPLMFKKHPQGFRLGWKNPRYREEHRGWRGWVPVTYDSAIGKKLSEYLIDPPHKLKTDVDNIVRRGDSVLCALPEEYWEARQRARVTKASHQRAEHQKDEREIAITQRTLERKDAPDPNSVPGSGAKMLS